MGSGSMLYAVKILYRLSYRPLRSGYDHFVLLLETHGGSGLGGLLFLPGHFCRVLRSLLAGEWVLLPGHLCFARPFLPGEVFFLSCLHGGLFCPVVGWFPVILARCFARSLPGGLVLLFGHFCPVCWCLCRSFLPSVLP